MFVAGGAQEIQPLRVGNDFRSIERVLYGIDELLAVAGEGFDFRCRQNFGGRDALVFHGRQDAPFYRRVYRRERNTQLDSRS
jgi:hypothetical protein